MDFWSDLDTLLRTDPYDTAKVGEILDLHNDLVAQQLKLLDEDDRYRCAKLLLRSEVYNKDINFSRNWLLNQLEAHDTKDAAYIETLGLLLNNDLEFHQILQPVLPVIVQLIWMYRFTELGILRTYLDILYRCLLATPLDNSDTIDKVSEELVLFLFRAVCQGADCQDEALLVLLALNDQYMLSAVNDSVNSANASSASATSPGSPTHENKVYSSLTKNRQKFRSIGGEVIVLLNRCIDVTLQTLIVKFLWMLFSHKSMADFFYVNDVNVLVDIIIRQLNDLGCENEGLQNMYLRLLYEILVNSSSDTVAPAFRSSITQVLRMTLEGSSLTDDTTRLAQRCLNVDWLMWSRHNSVEDPDTSLESNESSDNHTLSENNNSTGRLRSAYTPEVSSTPSPSFSGFHFPTKDDLSPFGDNLSDYFDPSGVNSKMPTSQLPGPSRPPGLQVQSGQPGQSGLQGPPAPPPPRNNSARSSSSSIAVAMVRPPPPPPPRPPPPRRLASRT